MAPVVFVSLGLFAGGVVAVVAGYKEGLVVCALVLMGWVTWWWILRDLKPKHPSHQLVCEAESLWQMIRAGGPIKTSELSDAVKYAISRKWLKLEGGYLHLDKREPFFRRPRPYPSELQALPDDERDLQTLLEISKMAHNNAPPDSEKE